MARSDGKSAFFVRCNLPYLTKRSSDFCPGTARSALPERCFGCAGIEDHRGDFLSQGERSPTERSALSSVHGQYVAVGGEICSETRDAPCSITVLIASCTDRLSPACCAFIRRVGRAGRRFWVMMEAPKLLVHLRRVLAS